MAYTGSLRVRTGGAYDECAYLLPVARVLIDQVKAMYNVSVDGVQQAHHTVTLEDGAVIRVAVYALTPPIVTLIPPPPVEEESEDPYRLVPHTPFVLAYGLLGPTDDDKDEGTYPDPEDDPVLASRAEQTENFRLVTPSPFQIVPGVDRSDWYDRLPYEKTYLVEALPPESGFFQDDNYTEGKEGDVLKQEGFDPRGERPMLVWRIVLENPLAEPSSESEVTSVLLPEGEAAYTDKLFENLPKLDEDEDEESTEPTEEPVYKDKLLAYGTFDRGALGFLLSSWPEDILNVGQLEPVPGLQIDPHEIAEWRRAAWYEGRGAIPLPSYTNKEVASDMFEDCTPYGQWLLHSSACEIPETTGRILPDGTLEGFPDSIGIPDAIDFDVQLHVRGGWGRLRVDAGIVVPVAKQILWPAIQERDPLNYAVDAVKKGACCLPRTLKRYSQYDTSGAIDIAEEFRDRNITGGSNVTWRILSERRGTVLYSGGVEVRDGGYRLKDLPVDARIRIRKVVSYMIWQEMEDRYTGDFIGTLSFATEPDFANGSWSSLHPIGIHDDGTLMNPYEWAGGTWDVVSGLLDSEGNPLFDHPLDQEVATTVVYSRPEDSGGLGPYGNGYDGWAIVYFYNHAALLLQLSCNGEWPEDE